MSIPFFGMRLPDGVINMDEYCKNCKFVEVPVETIERMNAAFLIKFDEFRAEDNASWAESANMTTGDE